MIQQTKGYAVIYEMLASKGFHPFTFQEETWQYLLYHESGLVNAPTGCGKTFSVFLGAIINFINDHPEDYQLKKQNGLRLLWITPLRALAKDIGRAMEEVIGELNMKWRVGIRNGDTSMAERQKQKRHMPEVLIITPESLHLLLAQKDYASAFRPLEIIAIDEWHELIGSKRGVQVELAISRIIGCRKPGIDDPALANHRLAIWGISATIGNLGEAKEVLMAPLQKEGVIVRANMDKRIEIESVFPDEIEKYPWAGHLGIKLAHKTIPIIEQSRTTLIFINTRGMSETWYQTLLDIQPELAGSIALHHGSIDTELRTWVEENLHSGNLKAVVCTASLDLGVDFRPVETVIQVGSPKGVARFLQRAGRSGHSPDAVSKIYFLPTHSLELAEAAALKTAIEHGTIESRPPMILCYDVMIQYLNTLAVSDGFRPAEIFQEIKQTWCYRDITESEWEQMLHFISSGGNALQQYDEYKKAEIEDGVYRIKSRRLAMRHRMHIGTIVSDSMMKVKFLSGGYIGVIEEGFISRLQPGDVFTLAGRHLEFVMIKEMTALVRKSNAKKSIVPSWQGGRMPLSANLGKILRQTFDLAGAGSDDNQPELVTLRPLFELQKKLSHVPAQDELLVEQIETRDGFHLFVYPFEGRLVHEAMAAILAFRISRITPITFSLAMNDYGFELLSDQPIPVDDSNVYELFSPDNLLADIQRSVNSTEMARRKFRDIAVIGGLIFQGYPGEQKKARHLQASASLLFNVFSEYEPNHVLLRQSYQEVLAQQMEELRLRDMLHRIQRSNIVITFPSKLTPFCFPIKVDSMREDLSSEKLEDRVRKMQLQLEK
ncbi:MAG: ligase-associated DNA damage response DEXH box helicase [Chitinophagaceae bacterium]|nr:ligase-associated DNA damage response DEXH box helicase [Chitinophagaceae bacterium]